MIGYVEQAEKEGATVVCGHGKEPLTLPQQNKNVRHINTPPCMTVYIHTLTVGLFYETNRHHQY